MTTPRTWSSVDRKGASVQTGGLAVRWTLQVPSSFFLARPTTPVLTQLEGELSHSTMVRDLGATEWPNTVSKLVWAIAAVS